MGYGMFLPSEPTTLTTHLDTIHLLTRLAASPAAPRDVIRQILDAAQTLAEGSHVALLVSPAMMMAITNKPMAKAQYAISESATLVTSGALADKIREGEGADCATAHDHIIVIPMNRGGIAIVDAHPNFLEREENRTALHILADLVTSALGIAGRIADADSRAETLEETQRRLREQNSLLRELTVIDSLTGLYNRRFFDRRLSYEIERWRRSDHPLSLVMFDVDHFKSINDTHGHHTGDLVLKHLAKVAKESTRDGDVLARHGGEEFVVLMPNSGLDAAANGAERLRKAIEVNALVFEGTAIPITISAGVAATERDVTQDAQALLRAADVALYNAKHLGRNRIETSRQVEGAK
jgi:diguanylate cyclase (GGDEF)-like protein